MATSRPTLRSLAAEAGVSAATVSLALRDSPEISPGLKKKIQALAVKRGYRTNPLVSAVFSHVRLRKPPGDSAVIAYLNTWWPKPAWESCSTKTAQFRGAARRAAELGFRLENFWINEPGMNPKRVAQIFRARGIRGVLVGPLHEQERDLGFPWGEFALSTMGYSLHQPAISRACHAHFRGMYFAMEEMIARGYRRIGYVTSTDFEDRVSSLWGAAYRFNQHLLAASDRIEPLVFKSEATDKPLKRWLEENKPDAIINALPGVYELLAGLKVKVPEDLGFVHLDLPVHLRTAKVCGIDQLSETVGAHALEIVASQLYTNASGVPEHPVTQLVEGVWVEGTSLRPRTSEKARGKSAAPVQS